MNFRYRKALKLRFAGKSYGEINQALGVPKSTLSSWFKNLQLPPSIQKILIEKGRVTRKHLMKFNQRRTRAIQIENQRINKEAVKEIRTLSKYELKLVGATLYWGEGYKNQKRKSKSVQLSNSDPYLVTLFLRFLREILKIPEEKLNVSLHVHPNINEKSTIKFWSKITGIPSERFHVTHQISGTSQRKRPSNSLPYGTLDLRVHNRQNFYKIKGWIDGLIRQACKKIT